MKLLLDQSLTHKTPDTLLLDDAYTSVGLSDAVISLIRENYDDGPVIDMLDALLYFQKLNSGGAAVGMQR
ncbi:hypothetical protein [Corynebacterium diphtheriae]|uniref:hypothetical protein n=1 Tax=Corynebacterium diphtheriae TaxID=1717 RepID=UPI000B4B9F6A|nr:hypothetical protein [Corynebacterium diphtheriae]OWN50115.1 hypothetical protein AY512_10150 [Corynebacterium diphtheriae bv. gravis]